MEQFCWQGKECQEFSQTKLKKGKLDTIQRDNMYVIVFNVKKKDIFLLTTIHGPDMACTGWKDRQTG